MFNIGPQELLLILLVALVVVGPQRLPELSRTIGRGLREFRKAQDEVKKTISLGLDEPASTSTRPAGAPTSARTPEVGATSEATAQAPAPPEPDEAADVARTLGRGLAEIRRAREEIQRTFRVDLSDRPTPRRSTAPSRSVTPPHEPGHPDAAAPEAEPPAPRSEMPAPEPSAPEAPAPASE